MYAVEVKKELEKASRELQDHITQFIDDFLRWYIVYGDEDSELIKVIDGPEEKQKEFLAKCRESVETNDLNGHSAKQRKSRKYKARFRRLKKYLTKCSKAGLLKPRFRLCSLSDST